MFLTKDIRRRWQQYGENRPFSLKKIRTKCVSCRARATQWDHIEAVGTRAYTIEDIVPYIKKMLHGKCQPMCARCNAAKGDK